MATLKIFKSEITAARNARVDNIDDYLATLTPTYQTTNLQYQQIATDLIVKLHMDQQFVGTSIGNYAVLDQDDRKYYFFVSGASWTAKKTVALHLVLDTINTYWADLSWNEKTSIQREHVNRYIGKTPTGALIRKIDRYSEGLDPVKTEEMANRVITDGSNDKWYVVYTSSDDISPDHTTDPIRALVVSTSSTELEPAISNTDDVDVIQSQTKIRYITSELAGTTPTVVAVVSGSQRHQLAPLGTVRLRSDGRPEVLRAYAYYYNYAITGNKHNIYAMYYTGDSYPYAFSTKTTLWEDVTSVNITNARYISEVNNTEYNRELTNLAQMNAGELFGINAGQVPALTSATFTDLDRSNPKFSKIIEMPYSPTEYFSSYEIDYGYKTYYKKLDDYSFGRALNDESVVLNVLLYNYVTPRLNQPINATNESKLYNSEFLDLHLTYDNVTQPIALENITYLDENAPHLSVYWYMTNDMSCTKMFDWSINSAGNAEYDYQSDFERYLISTRNTEKPIYNSGYADYMKTAYNYDQESNKIANRNAALSAAVGLAGAGAQLGTEIYSKVPGLQLANERLGDASGAFRGIKQLIQKSARAYRKADTPEQKMAIRRDQAELAGQAHEAHTNLLEARAGVANQFGGFTGLIAGQAISSINSAVTSMLSIQSNNREFQQNVAMKQYSGINITGQSSTDLMDIYGGGKLRLICRTLKDDIRNNITKTFHYVGYSHPVQEIPDFTSRTYFNYVQCTPIFNDENTSVYSDFLDDIKARFEMGLTVYHKVGNTWDFNQNYENWEANLING